MPCEIRSPPLALKRSQAIYIDDVSRIPMEFKYYQGPRTEIALTVAWRRVSQITLPADARIDICEDCREKWRPRQELNLRPTV